MGLASHLDACPIDQCAARDRADEGHLQARFSERRCVVPSTGYLEWLRDEKDWPKAKYLFRGQGGGLVRMAGLWEESVYRDVRERRFLALTRSMVLHAHVQDRTPVLLVDVSTPNLAVRGMQLARTVGASSL